MAQFGFVGGTNDMTDTSTIPLGTRWKFLLYAWGVAVVATILPDPLLVVFFPCFPLGLMALLGWGGQFLSQPDRGWLVGISGDDHRSIGHSATARLFRFLRPPLRHAAAKPRRML